MTVNETVSEMDDSEAMKAEWLGRLDALVGDVKTWAEESGWRTRRIGKTVNERRLGTYKVPVLLMEKDTVEAVLNPVARDMPGAAGAVDLYLAPAYDDIASLYFEDGRWVVHYAPPPDSLGPRSGLDISPMSFSSETIRAILDGMAAHA